MPCHNKDTIYRRSRVLWTQFSGRVLLCLPEKFQVPAATRAANSPGWASDFWPFLGIISAVSGSATRKIFTRPSWAFKHIGFSSIVSGRFRASGRSRPVLAAIQTHSSPKLVVQPAGKNFLKSFLERIKATVVALKKRSSYFRLDLSGLRVPGSCYASDSRDAYEFRERAFSIVTSEILVLLTTHRHILQEKMIATYRNFSFTSTMVHIFLQQLSWITTQ
ncbi:hypothetical protein AMTR_s00167p00016270 [Amborella trichopoda]|uniref:Uncharacterized protein n=1 Tax=Amborella trichopoda TaxID=13333 RepID=W1PS53_AMBTC|nr:hypothetical protein AMTR_s00167p00016270 [Amborella trichopoda]